MRTIVVCAVVLVAIANGIHGQSSPEGKKQICEPGKQTKVDCNTCRCSTDGTQQACTRMECPKIPAEYLNPDGTIKLPHEILKNPLLRTRRARVCEPGTERTWKCNTCRCSPDGSAEFCTRQVCPELPRRRRDLPHRCSPNKEFMDDCNHCHCSPDGRSASCTMMACPVSSDRLPTADRLKRDQVCVPNTERIWECNTCRCSPDGTAELCTRKICPEHPRDRRDAPFSCTPNESFMMECNQCVCAADGKSAACTLKFCV